MFESVQKRAAAFARDGIRVRRLIASCRKLLSERGEAAGVSLAKTTLDLYRELDRSDQARFFAALLAEFSPDPSAVLAAAQAYAAEPSAANLAQLSAVTEPPRQELLRRLNRAPGGTATILRMRERLLELKRDQRELEAVDWDFRHLLSSWFNPGFLQIVRVDWHTPAYLLEQIIAHEAVHEIQGWNDLRRRLEARWPLLRLLPSGAARRAADLRRGGADGPDGRRGLAAARRAVRGQGSEPAPAPPSSTRSATASRACAACRSATSSSSRWWTCCRANSRGSRCSARCRPSPASPPGSARCSRRREAERPAPLARGAARPSPRELGAESTKIAADPDGAVERLAPLKEPLLQLCAAYLLQRGDRSEPAQDPVARFHLNNGARLERINWSADVSKKGLRESLGMMVNYLYVPREIESNHEKFVQRRDRRLAARAHDGAAQLTSVPGSSHGHPPFRPRGLRLRVGIPRCALVLS